MKIWGQFERPEFNNLSPKLNCKKTCLFDDHERHSCRLCLCIHGIEIKEGDCGDVMEDIEKFCNTMRIPFNENKTDRALGIGKPFLDKERKKES